VNRRPFHSLHRPLRPARWLLAFVVLAAWLPLLSQTPQVRAAGPGLPKLTFASSEVFTPISLIQTTNASGAARGHGLATMHKGYLAVPYGRDSGQSGGGFAFFDISNPRSPQLVAKRDVNELREQHGFARSNSYEPGRSYVALQAGTGVEFWDWTDVTNPLKLSSIALPNVNFSDYDVGAWWLAWQAPFVYVAASGNGIYIVDATDPRNPTVVKNIPISQTGGFRIHPIFVVGNLLVATSVDFFTQTSTGIVTLDISDPRNPVVLKAQSTNLPVFYSAFFNGNKLIGLGNFDHKVHVWDLSNPSQFTFIDDIGGLDRPVYATVQDGHALVGDESSAVKVDIRSNTLSIVGEGTSGLGDRSEDIITPLGNMMFVGNDHGTGSAIIPHQSAPDNTGPAVTMVNPPNGAVNQALTSRVGVTLSDWFDLDSVTASSFIVRPVGGTALAGKYSGEQGIINFWPNTPLQANTTYEVVLPAGGIKDFSGNTTPTEFVSRFATGATINAPSVQVQPKPPALVNATVNFSIASSSGPGALTYSWDFGDGTPPTAFGSSSTASHSYSAPGHYSVKVTVASGAAQSSSSYIQTIHYAATTNKPSRSSTIMLDEARNRVWVVNADTDTVSAINGATNSKLLERPVGRHPRTLAQAPDGSIWVINQRDATISVLDRDTGNSLATIGLTPGTKPYGVAFAPNGGAAYVSSEGGQLIKLNPATRAVVSTLNLGAPLRGIAITSDSGRVLVTRFISPASKGEVIEVAASSFTVARTFNLALDPGPDGNTTGRGVPNYLSALTISPDGRQARVPSKKDNTGRGQFRDGQALTFESTVRTIVSQLDLVANSEPLSKRIDLNDRDMASAVAFSNLGDYIFVATQGTNTVEVFDAYNNRLMTGIPASGRAPQGLVLSADGKKLYVQSFMSRSVQIYDISGVVESTTNAYQQLATVSTVATETLGNNELAGKLIFYNADDRRMNRDGYIACASCHLDGDSDGRVWDFTDRGEGLRNTASLRGRAGLLHGNVHWSGNFDEVQDFENDIRDFFGGIGFMSDAQFNSGTRENPLGDPKAGIDADLDALAAFVRSFQRLGASPLRAANGSLTPDGQAGRLVFNQLQCYSCHAGSEFTDSRSGLLHNVGTIKASSGKRNGQTLTGLDTPTLKGLWETAPYLHDGSAATLLDVLTTATLQKNQLVAYLQQIDDAEGDSPPTKLLTSQLNGGQAVPATSSGGTGRARAVLAPDGTTLLVSLQLSGLGSSQTSAHIHGPAAAGATAPVLFTLPNGSFTNHTISLTAQQARDLKSGLLYIDVHTSGTPAGEIRGQLRDASVVPEQSSPYLSDRAWSSASNAWGPVERDTSNGENASGDGGPITLGGVVYAKGLGVHAASDVRYDLGGSCSTFQAQVGVDDEVGSNGSVVFQVWADATKVYDSGAMTGASATKTIDVSVAGANELRLVVTDGGNGNGNDHADWANARVNCSQMAYLSDRGWDAASNGWGPVEKDISVAEQAPDDGRALLLNGVKYAKGLGVHAPAEVRYALDGTCSRFKADVGLDDEKNGGAVVFQVWADAIKVYDSGIMTGTTATKTVDVGIAGAKELRLVVTDGGNGDGEDHADWADARLVCGSVAAPPTVTAVNDNTTGTGTNQFEYVGTWSYGAQSGAYQNDNHWSNATNAYYQVRFNGTQAKLYMGKASLHGIAAVSVDGGSETLIDLYAATRADGVLVYTSPTLAAGSHTLKVRVTGTKNASAGDTFVIADRVDVQ
jgi:DNA-binding beta-propeller fold protein YncE